MKTKTLCSLFSAVLLLSFFSCDLKLLRAPAPKEIEEPEPEPVEPVLPDDADFISFTGERYEKYQFKVDPALYARSMTLSGSANVSYSHSLDGSRTISGSNTMSITTTLGNLLNPATIYLSATGRLAYGYSIRFNRVDRVGFDQVWLNQTFIVYSTANTSISNLSFSRHYSEKDILRSFTSSSITLPVTAAYSDPYYEYKYHTYQYVLPASTLAASSSGVPAFPGPDINTDIYYYTGLTNNSVSGLQTNITMASSQTFDPYVLVSRDFYQYKSFTIRYQPGLTIHGFNIKPYPHPVINALSYDPDENSISVIFNSYNTPYKDSLFSYYIEAEDGTWREKIVSIE